jgi:hypothetical protein
MSGVRRPSPSASLVKRLAVFVALAASLAAVGAIVPAKASADSYVCGPSGYPYCTWAYSPRRGYSIGIFSQNGPYVFYGGTANYNGDTAKVCINVRLMVSTVIFKQTTYCHPGPTDTSTNTWDSDYVCCSYLYWYHTWAHSWQVFADGSTHNHRYVATGEVLL